MSLTNNITLDDFSSFGFTYSSNWNVPDTSNYGNPGNIIPITASIYSEGTYHQTSTINSSFNLSFTGPSISLYGLSGPSQGSYSIKLDSGTASIQSAYSTTNSTNHLLYSVTNLNSTSIHTLLVTNLGSNGATVGGNSLLVDYAKISSIVGAVGSTVTNTTVEDNDHSTLKYTGTWSSNNDTRFSGGTSTYTNTDGGSVSLSFSGSEVYVYGDTVIDHGTYQINLDNFPPTQYTAKTENLKMDTLKFFAGGLNNSIHNIKITNIGTTYFDLDRIVFSTPSAYYVVTPSSSTNSTATSSTSGSITAPPTSNSTGSASASAASTTSKGNSAKSSKRTGIKILSALGLLSFLIQCV